MSDCDAEQENDDGETRSYDLHAIGLSVPPPGRVASVRFSGPRFPGTWRAEARVKSDVYERGFGMLPNGLEFQGIPSEGVIVYEVSQQPDDISLHTILKVGERYQTVRSSVEVLAAIPDGFTLSIQTTPNPNVPGQLLFHSDAGTPGNVSNPVVVGFGG